MLTQLAAGTLAWLALLPPAGAQCAEWDTGFHSGFDGAVNAQCAFDDGSGPALYVGGAFTSAGPAMAARIARWDGAIWTAVGPAGLPIDGEVHALATFDDGSGPALYAGGAFFTAGGVPASRIARWDGTSWSPLGSGLNGTVYALATFDDGNGEALYAGGFFTSAGGTNAACVARWDGTSWTALGSGVNNRVQALASFDDGVTPRLVAGGQFTVAGGVAAPYLAAWDGSGWTTLGPAGVGMDNWVDTLATFDDGSGTALYAGGRFDSAGGVAAQRVAKWDGASWSALGSGTNDRVLTLATHDDGTGPALYAGGLFTTAGGSAASRIARWDGTSWSALGPPGSDTNGGVWTLLAFEDGGGPALYAGGNFDTVFGQFAPRLARWDGAGWSTPGPPPQGLSNLVLDLAVFDDGSGSALYAAGQFPSAGGTPALRIAEWNGTGWSALGSGLNATAHALTVIDLGAGPALYAGGSFLMAGGVSAPHIARWDGSSWAGLGSMNSDVFALTGFDDGLGPALYAGGQFTTAGGVGALRIARFDGSTWSALGPPGSGVDGQVWALASFDAGTGPELYVGGAFSTAGGVSAPRIARWDGTSWSALGPPGSGIDGAVLALAVHDDGSGVALYVGGSFTSAGGTLAPNIARWNGTTWSALGAGTDSAVRSLAVHDDGFGAALYAGGDFTTAGGVLAARVARWDGAAWSALGAPANGTNGTVSALVSHSDGSDGDPDLFVGGSFSSAGGSASNNIALWHGCANVPVPHCLGDGSASVCPCGNVGLSGRGCDNSAASGGAWLSASGTITPDTLVLAQQGELASSLSIFLQGSLELAAPVPFGDGLRCTGGALKRLYVKAASAGTAVAPAPGDPSITTQSAALGDPIVPGTTRHYQVYYRDPDLSFCPSPPGDGFNIGNALRVTW